MKLILVLPVTLAFTFMTGASFASEVPFTSFDDIEGVVSDSVIDPTEAVFLDPDQVGTVENQNGGAVTLNGVIPTESVFSFGMGDELGLEISSSSFFGIELPEPLIFFDIAVDSGESFLSLNIGAFSFTAEPDTSFTIENVALASDDGGFFVGVNGEVSFTPSIVESVPEPSTTMAILGTAGVGLFLRRKDRGV